MPQKVAKKVGIHFYANVLSEIKLPLPKKFKMQKYVVANSLSFNREPFKTMVIVASSLTSVLALGAGPNLAGNSYFVAAQGGGGSFNNSMWPCPIEDLGHI